MNINGLQRMTEAEEVETYGGAFLAVVATIPAIVLAITSITNLFRTFFGGNVGKDSGTFKTKEYEYKWDTEAPKQAAQPKAADSVPIYFGY